ncbi:hypothetical protein [Grimontia hollisae]|uniref:hypothetical protein n=1 Tax=Grimontia hollisae TaxID=673 RepID=UPI0013037DC8|nr:hypothetical protein [Grimontia hollisae]
MNITGTVTLWRERVVTVRLPTAVVQFCEKQPTKLQVVTMGAQGPVGTVGEPVLSRFEALDSATSEALSHSAENEQNLCQLISDMTNHFNYHAGVIST